MFKSLFHKHSTASMVIPANEIYGIKFHYAISLVTGEHHHFERKPCPEHGMHRMDTLGKCGAYGCSTNFRVIDMPNLSEIVVTYVKCLTCDYYTISVQCGMYKYVVNKEYIKLKIDELVKQKTDDETERLLNLGNPDYKPRIDYDKKLKEYEQVIVAQKETLDKLRDYTRQKLNQLNESRKNDDIWNVLPEKTKKDLYKKYGKNLQPFKEEQFNI